MSGDGGWFWTFGRTRTGEGGFENPRFWRTSFLDLRPLTFYIVQRGTAYLMNSPNNKKLKSFDL